jgi:hypothetical protein
MNNPESMVPIPDWYGKEALPVLKSMWKKFMEQQKLVDSEQVEHYNSVMKSEKIKKIVPERSISFGDYLFVFFGFRIDYQDGIPCVSETALQKVKETLAQASLVRTSA